MRGLPRRCGGIDAPREGCDPGELADQRAVDEGDAIRRPDQAADVLDAGRVAQMRLAMVDHRVPVQGAVRLGMEREQAGVQSQNQLSSTGVLR